MQTTRTVMAGLLAVLAWKAPVFAQTNFWTNSVSGKWETVSNWSLGAPGPGDSVYITNAATKTVRIDSTTSVSFSNTLSVTNLTLSAPSNSVNTLLLSNSTLPLNVHETFTLLSGGALNVTNSTFAVDCGRPPVGNTDNGSLVQIDGPATFINSTLNASNAFSTIVGETLGGSGAGTLNMTNSTMRAYKLYVGDFSDGTANFVNVTNRLGFWLVAGEVLGHTGRVAILGGQLVATNTAFGPDTKTALIGNRGTGQLTVSNATVRLNTVVVGAIKGSVGSLTLQSGSMTLGKTYVGTDAEPGGPPFANGLVQVSGGQLFAPELHIGYQATGTVAVAGGLLSNAVVAVSENSNAVGGLTISGGTHLVSASLTVGSNGVPGTVSVTGGNLLVTNAAGTATLTLNASTLTHLGGVFKTDNLLLTNGGSVVTTSNYVFGAAAGATNLLALSSGSSLVITNAGLFLGNNGALTNGSGIANAVVTNASVSAGVLALGSTTGGLGTITLQSNALLNIASNITVVSSSLSSTSSVTLNGGSLSATSGLTQIGSAGSGQLSINSGIATLRQLKLGGAAGAASGNLYLNGGLLRILESASANFIVVGGGDLDGSGGTVIIGENHDAAMSVTAGSATNIGTLFVGYSPGFTGTLTQNGGLMKVATNLVVGDCASNSTGVVTLGGGTLYVTNAAHTAVLDVRQGSFRMTGGALVVDNLVVTNGCGGVFSRSGGTLLAANVVLDPNGDSDGDGQSNAAEAQAGTDPLDATSVFRVLAVTRANDDVRVDWCSVGGHSYFVQAAAVDARGGLTTNFSDVSPVINVGGSGPGTSSYTHSGAGRNATGYYRVRLGP